MTSAGITIETLQHERLKQLLEARDSDPEGRDVTMLEAAWDEHGPPLRAITERFIDGTVDLENFRAEVDRIGRSTRGLGFGGPGGAMFLNQLAKDGTNHGVTEVLRRALPAPADRSTARRMVDALAELVEKLRRDGSAAAVGRIPFFLTWFWRLQDASWRPMWPSVERAALALGWVISDATTRTQGPSRPGERVEDYYALFDSLGGNVALNEEALVHFDARGPLSAGLDCSLADRCAFVKALQTAAPGDDSTSQERAEYDLAHQLMRAAERDLRSPGKTLAPIVSEALGVEVDAHTPSEYWVVQSKAVREDAWVRWRPQGASMTPSIRLHIVPSGVYLVVNPEPQVNEKGYAERAMRRLRESGLADEFEWRKSYVPGEGLMEPWSDGDSLPWACVGIALPPDTTRSESGLREAVRAGAMSLAPVFAALTEGTPIPPTAAAEDLASLVETEAEEEDDLSARLADAAADLYLDDDFLVGLYGRLSKSQQLIFYGPPGTGKTFIAQRLAAAIAPDPAHRMLIQFHPSTSYEDFMEGYRPITTADGSLSYELVPGPLRLMARAAAENPGTPHVLIVDEINRANLPKVFGELLFLLEYRDKVVRPLYRPEEEFSLPENLWVIGTMNTADRSVALLDAALRRRFQFIPFIPDIDGKNPVASVLRRWVDANGELDVLPDMLDRVNNKLRVDLGGDHLLLGPSYFMKRALDESQLRDIWTFQIEPLIEDVFFGQTDRINSYRFDAVWAEFGPDGLPAEAMEPE